MFTANDPPLIHTVNERRAPVALNHPCVLASLTDSRIPSLSAHLTPRATCCAALLGNGRAGGFGLAVSESWTRSQVCSV